MQYTEQHLEYIHELRLLGSKWGAIQKDFNKKFKLDKSLDTLRITYAGYKELLDSGLPEVDVALLRQARTASKTSAKNRRAMNITLDAMEQDIDIVEKLSHVITRAKLKPVKSPTPTHRHPSQTPMIMEVLLSDLHYGKKTDTFNLVVARSRMKAYAEVIMDQYKLQTGLGFHVESIDLAFLGDIIESATMHGIESARSCEVGNSEQVVAAIQSLFADLIVPLSSLGVPMKALCITGNHSRTSPQKTYIKPGLEHLSWIIYNSLELLCQHAKVPATFTIAEGPTLLHSIFDDYVLYEHFDLVKACTKKSFSDMLAKRQTQYGEIINFYRGGHYHEFTMFDRGRIIVNGCLPGNDDYAESFGYNSESSQTINFYCKNKNRPNSYYYTFPVYLGADT